MAPTDNKTYNRLRTEFKWFEYEKFSVSTEKNRILLSFRFNLSGKYFFEPSYVIPYYNNVLPDEKFLENIAFHIGMVELVSYWKTACSPQVIIKPFSLNESQIKWWKNLYFNGLGEFFWLNGITPDVHDFMHIETHGQELQMHNNTRCLKDSNVIVPVGGGKDSVVSLELLKDNYNVIPFAVNPRNAIYNTLEASGFKRNSIFGIQRNLDPLLYELNAKGFLNGHTPFSAVVAFTALLAACLSDSKYIALSNEASANEPTVPGSKINHQYSKSLDFERDFRSYTKDYLSDVIEYFSFLRPLSELQIAAVFSTMRHQFKHFRSCNVGSKTDSWCCACPKCLFTAIILSPFIDTKDLINIFGENLFEKPDLLIDLEKLSGMTAEKPFECVGTTDEVNIALNALAGKTGEQSMLVKHYIGRRNPEINFPEIQNYDFSAFHSEHYLPPNFAKILKERCSNI